jgi:muramidase (phage lysozyme)
MHPDVPRGAAILLDFIGVTETGKAGPEGYGVVYGHNQGKLKKPITSWTLDEVEADGPRRTKAYGSSAAGRYQFMRDTLDSPARFSTSRARWACLAGRCSRQPFRT